MITSNTVYSILAITTTSYLLSLWLKRRNRIPLPPGPRGYPLIGSVYEIPHHHAWLTYAEWAKKYGDVLSFTVFGETNIIINSLEAATELLDKRSSNYSDRPRMVMANELMDWGWDMAHMPYSDRWRRHRRMFHQYFQPRNLASYYPIQTKLAVVLSDQLVQTPQDFAAHIRQYVGAVVLQAAYGYEVKAENDFYIKLAHDAIQPLLLVVHATGNFLVEFLPSLKHVPKWMPGAGFKRNAKIWAKGPRDLLEIPFNAVTQAIAEGSAKQSFVFDNLERIRADDSLDFETESEVVKNCAGIVYLAGSDTTASLLIGWVLAMAHNPEVQKKGQQEVDQVLRKSRLPDFDDRDAMPYTDAMVLETMRWIAITPLALPHRTLKEDIYKGFRIPAGASVTPNAWAILHDEKLYPEPFKFKPERFIKNGKVSFEDQPDPLVAGCFGYGRRLCPGRYLAMNSAWLAIVSILATSHIGKSVDESGNTIEPEIGFTDGLVIHPKPFKVKFTPRFEGVKAIIESAK